jgi:hypothetical protein
METNAMQAAMGAGVLVATLIVWVVLFAGLAIGNGFIAARLGKSVPLWVILSLIPGYNLFFLYYVWFYVIGRVLNRLNQIADHVGAHPGPAV